MYSIVEVTTDTDCLCSSQRTIETVTLSKELDSALIAMHPTAWLSAFLFFEFLHDFLSVSQNSHEDAKLRVLDFGSYDVNGNFRDVLLASSFYLDKGSSKIGKERSSMKDGGRRATDILAEYVGVDMSAGFNVDKVVDPSTPISDVFAEGEFDLVISGNAFEHDDFFWETFLRLCYVLKPGGFMYLNVPSKMHIHRYPVDNWRFLPDSTHALCKYAQRHGYDMRVIFSELLVGEEGDLNSIIWKVPSPSDSAGTNTMLSAIDGVFQHYHLSTIVNTKHLYMLTNRTVTSDMDESNSEEITQMNYQNTSSSAELIVGDDVAGDSEGIATDASGESIQNKLIDGNLFHSSYNSSYKILSNEFLLKIRNYYISYHYCRNDIEFKHPVENLAKRHIEIPIVLTELCEFLLHMILTEEDLSDNQKMFRTLELIQERIQIFQPLLSTTVLNYLIHESTDLSKYTFRDPVY